MSKKSHVRPWLVTPLALAIAVSTTILSGSAIAQNQRVDEAAQTSARNAEFAGFSFAYRFERDRSVAPFQVFDDGEVMFLQFRENSNLPTMMVRDANGSRVIAPEFDGPYVKLPNLYSRIDLIMPDGRNAAIVSTRRTQNWPAALPPTRQLTEMRSTGIKATHTAQAIPATPSVHANEQALNRTVWVAPAPPTVSESAVAAPAGIASIPMTQSQEIAELRSQVQSLTSALTVLVQRMDAIMATDSRSLARPTAVRPQASAPVPVAPLRMAAASPREASMQQFVKATSPVAEATAPASSASVQGASLPTPTVARAPAVVPAGAVAQAAVITQGTAPAVGTADLVEYRQSWFEFKVVDGMRLSEAVRQLALQQKLSLDWDTGNKDFIVRFGYTIKAPSLEVLLKSVLSPYRLSATVSLGNNLLAVSSAT